jgi:glutamine amidotransferase
MIAIIDYGMGNVGSVLNMFRKVGASATISRDSRVIADAQALVLPGVGAFDHGIRQLQKTGLVPMIERRVLRDGVPILGICLGLQLLTRGSEEGGEPGLGWLPARTVRFRLEEPEHVGLKIPHMGWNEVRRNPSRSNWASLAGEPRFYFVHSYHLDCDHEEDIVATAHYGYEIPVVVARNNVSGTQFHPEKSHRFGMALLRDFSENV